MRRPRGGALEQNEQKPENCSRALFSEPILMTYTLKDRKCFADAEFEFIWTYKRSSEVKLGSNRRIRVKSGELVEIYPIYVSTKTFLKNSDLIFFDVNQSSNLGQIRPIGVKSSRLVKISQIYMFRLRMFSGIEIQY